MRRRLYVLLILVMLVQACTAARPAVAPLPPAASGKARPAGATARPKLVGAITCADVTTNDAFESQVIDLTNAERAKQNLPPFKAQAQLGAAARAHSLDQACNNNLTHDGSDGSDVGDRITRQNYNFGFWRENVAGGQTTPQDVVNSWMNSPGHKANILSADVTEIGVGYIFRDATDGKHWWTQVFAAPPPTP